MNEKTENKATKVVKRQGSFLVVVSQTDKGKILSLSSKGEKQEGIMTNYREKETNHFSQCSVINIMLKEKKSIEETARFLVASHLFPDKKSYDKRAQEGLIDILQDDKGNRTFKIKDDKAKEKLFLLAKARVLIHLKKEGSYLSYKVTTPVP
jgi:hypothetical protein